ncbi:glycoside hydrolase family 15 protein [Rhizosphaericola mali]|uniref:Glycoside hydrolase family 15 protein n=1 Tax=Rhizosphaericola mali TaxID=2545455 RepID=A0A5P2G9Y6_9BACT|nr:glycoside hydrolase family 15 protein [Rhizosphaericola mali]QES90013.1 glycoside hydrolase family 15 protein [Rhizosphaericola mali]
MAVHKYDSGIIGNCSYIAHVRKDTNISWLCWPKFDSSFVFGGMLDENKGGAFYILPEGEYSSKQYYVENTNIICTEITNAYGTYRVTDFAPRFSNFNRMFRPLNLMRKVECLSGAPRVKIICKPVLDYGNIPLQPLIGSNHLHFTYGETSIRLTTNASINYIAEEQYFVLNDTKYFVLSYGEPFEAELETTFERFLAETIKYWRNWVKDSSILRFNQLAVIRSALALKLHQFEDTGAFIAASTTSLPEFPGEGRNWDYRFCWLRDTHYVINALNNIGHFDELEQYFSYVSSISFTEQDRYQPLYGITGEKTLTEKTLDLDGYLGNKPVHIGNQAYEHIQNDIYGQVLISLLPLYLDKRFVFKERNDSSYWIDFILKKIEKTINEKDAGIWEFRNMPNTHCYTNLFQWAGAKAALKMSRELKDKKLIARAIKLIKNAETNIEACYDPERKVYTHAVGSPYLDASTLQLIIMNYLDPHSQKAKDHLKGLEKELKGKNGLFYRYIHQDDFGKPTSTFLICAFWYVEALALVGRNKDAISTFDKLMQYSNHLGLFSEDVDENDGSQWGNFPQAYSHVGLMNAAYRISVKLDKPIYW